MLVSQNSSVDSGLFGKNCLNKNKKNTGAKYAVTISGGRQRHNASTRESLSGANVLQQQAAARSSNTLHVVLLQVLMLLLLYDTYRVCGYVV